MLAPTNKGEKMKAILAAILLLIASATYAAEGSWDTDLARVGAAAKRSYLVESGLFKPTAEAIRQRYVTEARPMAGEAVLEAARGEAESFQVIFIPTGARTGPERLEFKDFRMAGPKGARLSAGSVKVFRVGYVLTPGKKRLPDPLFDELNQGEFTDPCVVWATVTVPRNAAPGSYAGKLILLADGKELTISVRLTVWDLEVPKVGHLKTDFWFFRAQIKRYYGKKSDPSFQTYSRYLDLALEHRLTPIDCCEGNVAPLYKIYREADGKLTIDWTEFDRYAEYILARGATTLHLAPTHWYNKRFSDQLTGAYDPEVIIDRPSGRWDTVAYPYLSKEHLEMLKWYLRGAVAHFREKGWLQYAFLQPMDEVGETEENRLILQACRDADPAVKILMDVVRPREAKLFRNLIDIWCPLTPGMPDGDFDKARAEGDQTWWYVCCGPQPPYANLFTNQSCVEHRQLFWQSWKYGSQGVLYWGINFWNWWGNEPKYSVETCWPNTSWTYGNTAGELCGDGYFIYPGLKGPLGSIRLEAIRDGLEDYEYLWLLNQRVQSAEKRGTSADKLAPAKALLAIPESFCKDLTHYSTSEQDLARLRRQVAGEIGKLK